MSNSDISKLVEKQMRNWELARAQRLGGLPSEKPEVGDFLCLSRMAGIDSTEVADQLGTRLGWPVFDRRLLELMARDDFHRKQLYALMDKSDIHWSGQVITAFFEKSILANDYFRRLCDTLLLLVRQGNGVFVGRGSELILPRGHGFRARLAAPLESRTAWLAEAKGIAASAARQEIEGIERERQEYFEHHFKVRADDPTRFDVTVNVERFTAGQVVELILAARKIRRES